MSALELVPAEASIALVKPTPSTTHRGTTNRNARGGSDDRRRRREWLVATYRADVDVIRVTWEDESQTLYYPTDRAMFAAWAGLESDSMVIDVEILPAARCYRCGCLLHEGTVTVDRITPGCKGGTYRRNNIRPACGDCNSETGGALASKPKRGGRS